MKKKIDFKNPGITRILLSVYIVLVGFPVTFVAFTFVREPANWTIQTDDTKLTLGIGEDQKLYIYEFSNPAAGWNWTGVPSPFPLINRIDLAGKQYKTNWVYLDGQLDTKDGSRVTIHFINRDPAMELTVCWHARSGPGPVRHTMWLKNISGHTVTIYNQESLDLQITTPEKSPDIYFFNDMGWARNGYGGESGEGMFKNKLVGGYSRVLNFSDQSGYMPYMVVDADGKNGIYLGCEWIFGRIFIGAADDPGNVQLKAGNGDNFKTDVDDGEIFHVPPAFIGAYNGDLDESGNSLRQYLYNYAMPAIVRNEGYPKVQFNAFNSFADKPGSWNPVQDKFFSAVDQISSMGFEEIMFDVGWWEGNTKILPRVPKFDPVDWSIGPDAIRRYLSYKNIRWGLYWDRPAKMTSGFGISDRINQIKYMYDTWKIDSWRSDGTAGALITQGTWNSDVTEQTFPEGSYGPGTLAHYPEDVNYWQCKGFYEVVDNLSASIHNFQWENCEGGGQITDFGTMSRCVKIQITDNVVPLDMHRSFYDHLYMFHPVQLMGFCKEGEGNMKYMFRSAFMGAGNLTIDPDDLDVQDKKDLAACIISYKEKIRPLINSPFLRVYHVFPRADNHVWTGIEYFNPESQKGVVYIFKPDNDQKMKNVKLRGLDPNYNYQLEFEDGTNPDVVLTGKDLMNTGVNVSLQGKFISELLFIEKK